MKVFSTSRRVFFWQFSIPNCTGLSHNIWQFLPSFLISHTLLFLLLLDSNGVILWSIHPLYRSILVSLVPSFLSFFLCHFLTDVIEMVGSLSRTVPSASMHRLRLCRKESTTRAYSLAHTVCLQFRCFMAPLNTLLLLLWSKSNYSLIYSGTGAGFFFFFFFLSFFTLHFWTPYKSNLL